MTTPSSKKGSGTSRRDRMITAGELSTILAHEIKNPMNSIIINLEILRHSISEVVKGNESPASEKAKKYLGVIEGEIRRLDKVIKGFLDFASPSEAANIAFKINPLIENTVEFMRHEMQLKRILVQMDLHPDVPVLWGSPDQIKQALLNLLVNALQSLPTGGTITLRSDFTETSVLVSVRDTGCGIEKSIRDKIFTPYFTTKEKGSGLGLSIVKRVMNHHRGKIKLQSSPERGTEFTLIFPRAKGGAL